jgi:hypothetical protein
MKHGILKRNASEIVQHARFLLCCTDGFASSVQSILLGTLPAKEAVKKQAREQRLQWWDSHLPTATRAQLILAASVAAAFLACDLPGPAF